MVSFAAWSVLLLAGLSAVVSGGSSPATIEQFPSTVQIEFGYGNVWVQYCVGNLITNRHVLSVAHCFYGPLFELRLRRIRAGATYRGRDGITAGVSYVKNHPNFSILNGFTYDITVVAMDTYLHAGPTINYIYIPAQGVSFPDNVRVQVAAWGRTTQDAIWADRELRSNALYTVNRRACKEKYGSLPVPITISETMLCARLPYEDGQNLGIRDGGAPFIYGNVLFGMVSFGSPYSDNYPLVATDVSSLSDWIVRNAV